MSSPAMQGEEETEQEIIPGGGQATALAEECGQKAGQGAGVGCMQAGD